MLKRLLQPHSTEVLTPTHHKREPTCPKWQPPGPCISTVSIPGWSREEGSWEAELVLAKHMWGNTVDVTKAQLEESRSQLSHHSVFLRAHSKTHEPKAKLRAQAQTLPRCHTVTRAPWHPATGPLCSTTLPVKLFTTQASAGCLSFVLKPPQEESWQQAGICHNHLLAQHEVEKRGALQPAPKSVQDSRGSKCVEDIAGKGRTRWALARGFFTYSHQHTDVTFLPPCPHHTARLLQTSSCLCSAVPARKQVGLTLVMR